MFELLARLSHPSGASLNVLKVLIVEDDMFVSWGLESALAERGHHVCAIARSVNFPVDVEPKVTGPAGS